MNTPSPSPVRRRLVYYLAGFDTRSARFYHQLYKTEAALQQPVNGCEYEVGDPVPDGPHCATWTVRARCGGSSVETRYSFLHWNDIVREHWPASSARVASRLPAFYWTYWRNGGVGKTWRLCRAFGWMLMLPLLFVLAGLLVAGLAALGAAALAMRWAPGGSLGTTATWLAAGIAGALVFQGALVATERSRVFWLMRAWTFMLHWGQKSDPLQARWDEFAQKIESDLLTEPVDEVLIIGHSAGAMSAIAVAERWLALARDGRMPPDKVKLVTIGNATPLLGVIPEAEWFRRQIAAVGASDMPWIDYTAPSDPLCYALVNPFVACGLPSPERKTYRVKSARFDKMFRPEDYAQVRRDYFRIHFQYLMSTWQPVENDYFSLTAGPWPLVVDSSAT